MPRTSEIWSIPVSDFRKIIEESATYTEALKHFNLRNVGGNYKTLKARIAAEGLGVSHFEAGAYAARVAGLNKRRTPLVEIMVKNSTYNKCHLKTRLLEGGILKNQCAECGQNKEWKGLPLVMVLDHINGEPTDHRR